MAVDPASARRRRSLTVTAVLLVLFLLGVWGSVSTIGWDQASQAVSRLSLAQIFALLGLASLHYVLRALRWHILARAIGFPGRLGRNLLQFFAGFAMTATPGRLGELVRLRWMCADSGWKVERVAPVALADRAIELVGMLVTIVLAAAMMSTGIAGLFWLVAVAAGLVWVALYPRLLEYLLVMAWRILGRGARLFARLRRMVRGMQPFLRPRVLVTTSLMSAVGWLLEGVALYVLLIWLGAEISLAAATAIFLVAVLSGALSGLPGGLGGTEVVNVGLLALHGVPLDVAVISTVVLRAATLWYAVVIGAIAFAICEARLHRKPAPAR